MFSAVMLAFVVAVIVANSTAGDMDSSGEPLRPDLWTSAPFELLVAEVEGRDVLRFTSEMNNRGAGDLILRGNPNTSEIDQWVQHRESGHSVERLDLNVVWGGDTHDHWHIADAARYWVAHPDGTRVGEEFDNKVGFCIFDSVDFQSGLTGAPDDVRYQVAGCGGRLSDQIAMGLSVGWGDQYRFDLAGQFIDIEDLPPGDYLLMAEVDPDDLFEESDRTNNTAATPFTLSIEAGRRTITTG